MAEPCIPGEQVKGTLDPHVFEAFDRELIPPPLPIWEVSLKVLFYVFSFLVDLVGNSIVVLIIVLNKKMRTTTNCLLLNLAISDLMVGTFCMWVHLGNQITSEWPFGQFVCKVNTFIQVMSVTASVLTLTVISVERFLAIVFPLKAKMSKLAVGIAMATTWFLSAGVASPHLVVRNQYEYFWANSHEIQCEEVWPMVYVDTQCNSHTPGRTIYYTVEGVIMYFIPIAIMLTAYTLIVIKMVIRKVPGMRMGSTAFVQDRSKRKVVRMLVIVMIVFIICWTPQQVILLWDIYRERNVKPPEYVKTVKYIALYFAYTNSALNPILYGGFNENFRRGFKEAFRCHLWKKRNAVFNSLKNVSGPGIQRSPEYRLLTDAVRSSYCVQAGSGTTRCDIVRGGSHPAS